MQIFSKSYTPGDPLYSYRLGSRLITSNIEYSRLSMYVEPGAVENGSMVAPKSVSLANEAHVLRYAGRAPLAGRERAIELEQWGALLRLKVDGVLAFSIFPNENVAVCELETPSSDLSLELMTGPVFVLLALQEPLYCIHASSVFTPNGLVVMLAESGTGKSTLSRSALPDWQQVCDDVLPINAHTLKIEPHFPQLKLTNAQAHYSTKLMEQQCKPALLVRLAVEPTPSIELRPLAPLQATLEIVRHTVGAKLFSEHDLAQHLRFAQKLASEVTMIECRYPRSMSQIPEVRSSIMSACVTHAT